MTEFTSREMEHVLSMNPSTFRWLCGQLPLTPSEGRGKVRVFSIADAVTLIAAQELMNLGAEAPVAVGFAERLRGQIRRLMLDDQAHFFIFFAVAPKGSDQKLDFCETADLAEAADLFSSLPAGSFINGREILRTAFAKLRDHLKSQETPDA